MFLLLNLPSRASIPSWPDGHSVSVTDERRQASWLGVCDTGDRFRVGRLGIQFNKIFVCVWQGEG